MTRKLIALIIPVLFFGCKSHRSDGGDAAPLENTRWLLMEAGGVAVTTPAGGRDVYMILTRDGETGMIKGFAGCNGLGGNFTLKGEEIKFEPITTRMYCELQMELENIFVRLLTAADTYRIRDEHLELFGGGALLGRFEAKPVE